MAIKGQKQTEEVKAKISAKRKLQGNFRIGTKHSQETKDKMSLKAIGNDNALNTKHVKSELGKKNISISLKNAYKSGTKVAPWTGKERSLETKQKIAEANKGRVLSKELKKLISLRQTGNKHWNWQGGKSNRDIHSLNNPQYKKWRMSVFERDCFKCRLSDDKCSIELQAHHILRWSEFPKLHYKVNNGITLCRVHHPRKKAEEKRLEPLFNELVSVSK